MKIKGLFGLVPVFAIVAFAVAVSVAQAAETKNYGVVKHGTFEAFTKATSIEGKGTTSYKLENTAKTAGITCTSLSTSGTVENVSGVGHSSETLKYDGCKGTGELVELCTDPNGTGDIEGKVTDEVTSETKVKVTLTSGFGVECDGEDLGDVTGSASGTEAKGSGVLTFTEAPGLEFLKEPSTITGSVETKTAAATKEVVEIN